MTTEISTNLRISEGDDMYRSLACLDTPELLVSKTHVTFIEPPYNSMYRRGILPIIHGIREASTRLVKLDNGQEVHASIYGTLDAPNATLRGQATSLLTVNIHRGFLGMLDDPEAALDAYHRNLIRQTNVLLDAVESPYRLTPIND